MSTLVILQSQKKASLLSSNIASITAAKQFNQPITALIIGPNAAEQAIHVAKLDGVNQVIFNQHRAYKQGVASNISRLIESISPDYNTFLTAATQWGKNFMPRVAAKLNVGQLSDVTRIIDHQTFERPIYAGSAVITVKSLDPIKVLTIRSTCFNHSINEQPAAEVIENNAVFEQPNVNWIKLTQSESRFADLCTAEVIISGGRGFTNQQQFEDLLFPLAQKLGAAIGASRAAVDAGYISNDYQIGQTGKVVAPKIYIAIGISGASQHLAGMLDSEIIIAINKDPNAKIHSIADYSLIEDASNAINALLK